MGKSHDGQRSDISTKIGARFQTASANSPQLKLGHEIQPFSNYSTRIIYTFNLFSNTVADFLIFLPSLKMQILQCDRHV